MTTVIGEEPTDVAPDDADGSEEDDYQVFGRMTIKAQSEAFYQVSLQQKENSAAASRPAPHRPRRGRTACYLCCRLAVTPGL